MTVAIEEPAPGTGRRRRRRRIAIGGSIALALGVVVLVVLTAYVVNRALVAKDALESAQGRLTAVRAALGQPGAPSTAKLAVALQTDTAKAARQVHDPVWSLYEHIPGIGPNLIAFRQTAVTVNDLVDDGVSPLAEAADGLSVDSLKPQNGRIDIAPLKRLAPAVVTLDRAVSVADRRVAAIDTHGVVGQLRSPIAQLRTTLGEIAPVTHELRQVVPVLYPALGGDGTRHYLLMFQNNAEERASGGNPASLAMLVVDDGRISLGRQPNSQDFPEPYAKAPLTPTGPGNEDWSKIYTVYASTFLTNITMTPDFPSTAEMARAMWRKQYGGKVDGVISFDPVALSYLLKATGPLKLADGHTIDSRNAVDYLLYDVYAKYPIPAVQDAIFASAAKAVFEAVTNGRGDPQEYLTQLTPMLAEQRLKLWSVREDEQRLLIDSPVGNMLPVDNSVKTVLGVYNNDDATSKMSYFMDEKVAVLTDRCTPTPTYSVTATVTNTLPVSRVASLPEYVRAHQPRIVAGGDRQWVQLYGPVGSKLVSVTIDGKKVVWGTNLQTIGNTNLDATGVPGHRPAVQGEMYGRPVGVVSINMGPASSMTVRGVFTGGSDPTTPVAVSHTPKVRAVPVALTTTRCG